MVDVQSQLRFPRGSCMSQQASHLERKFVFIMELPDGPRTFGAANPFPPHVVFCHKHERLRMDKRY